MKPSKSTWRSAISSKKTFGAGYSRRLILLIIIAALGSLIVLSTVFAERNNTATASNSSPDRLKPSTPVLARSNQDPALPSGATRVDVEPVNPKVFHGDLRRLPLVKPQIKKPRPEPKEPLGELLSML